MTASYGKILRFSSCGKFVAIEARYYTPGVRRTGRQSTADDAIAVALNGNATSITSTDASYYVAVNVADQLERSPGLFEELVATYGRMQRDDPHDRITDKGALKVARMAWSVHLNTMTKAAADTESKKELDANALTASLHDLDID